MKKPPTNAEKFQEVFNMEPHDMILMNRAPGDKWWDEPWAGSNEDPEYDEYRDFMNKYGQVMKQLLSYKIPEARAALIISQVLAIYEGCEER